MTNFSILLLLSSLWLSFDHLSHQQPSCIGCGWWASGNCTFTSLWHAQSHKQKHNPHTCGDENFVYDLWNKYILRIFVSTLSPLKSQFVKKRLLNNKCEYRSDICLTGMLCIFIEFFVVFFGRGFLKNAIKCKRDYGNILKNSIIPRERILGFSTFGAYFNLKNNNCSLFAQGCWILGFFLETEVI